MLENGKMDSNTDKKL